MFTRRYHEQALEPKVSPIAAAYNVFTTMTLGHEGPNVTRDKQEQVLQKFSRGFLENIEQKFTKAVEKNDFLVDNVHCNGVVLYSALLSAALDGENLYSVLCDARGCKDMMHKATVRLNAMGNADDVRLYVTFCRMNWNESLDSFGIIATFE
jgi:hypothetical protein